MQNKWRLIVDDVDDAFVNMAKDEAIFQFLLNGNSFSTLRFYLWKPHAISIGRYQNIEEINLKKCEELKIDYTRRLTGGGCVLHSNELTYSFITTDEKFLSFSILDSYQIINKVLIKALDQLGIKSDLNDKKPDISEIKNFCFLSPSLYDILVQGKKIIGSAQKRTKKIFFQHGSILLNRDQRIKSIVKKNEELKDSNDLMIGINEIIEKISLDKIQEAIIKNFEKSFEIKFNKEEISQEEKNEAKKLENKYKSKKWIIEGKYA